MDNLIAVLSTIMLLLVLMILLLRSIQKDYELKRFGVVSKKEGRE